MLFSCVMGLFGNRKPTSELSVSPHESRRVDHEDPLSVALSVSVRAMVRAPWRLGLNAHSHTTLSQTLKPGRALHRHRATHAHMCLRRSRTALELYRGAAENPWAPSPLLSVHGATGSLMESMPIASTHRGVLVTAAARSAQSPRCTGSRRCRRSPCASSRSSRPPTARARRPRGG